MTTANQKQWQLKALTEALGDLTLTVADTLTIGRGKENDVVLGSKQVSRQHAELNVLNGKLFIKDLGSSNGTLVNDIKIDANKSKHLKLNDTVSFATFHFRVNQALPHQASQPNPVSEASQSSQSEPVLATSASPVAASTSTTVAPEPQAVPEEHTLTAQDDYPVKTQDVDTITEAKLKEELEAPIPVGDPDQDTHHKATTQPLNKPDGTVHTRHDDETSAEHFKELAAEADPEVLRAKQAAAAKFSGTVGVNHDEPQSTLNPKPAPSITNPVVKGHSNAATTTSTAQGQPATATGGGNGKWIMIILAIIILAIAIWLFGSGVSA